MNHRLASAAAITVLAVTATACSGSSGSTGDLGGTAGVTAPGTSAPGTSAPGTSAPGTSSSGPSSTGATQATGDSSTSSPPPTVTSPTNAEPNAFATRAGIADRRYTDAGASLRIADQGGAGRSVRIEEAKLSRTSGFVAIFTTSGTLLGSASVTPKSSPVTVSLDTRVPATGELEAVLFVDDGDGRFSLTKDTAVNDGDTDPDDLLDLQDEDFDYTVR